MAQGNVIDFTPVLETGALAAHDVFSTAGEIAGFFPDVQSAVKLVSVIALDGDDQNAVFDLIFSNATITIGTLNGAINVSDADAAKIVGYVVVASGDSNDTINSRLFAKNDINQIMKPSGLTTSVWLSLICRSGTPTYTVSGMKLKIGYESVA